MMKVIFILDESSKFSGDGKLLLFLRKIVKITMRKSILCVIDFSDSSRKVLQWALEEAAMLKTHITILYPYRLSPPKNGETVMSLKQKIEAQAVKNFEILEKELLINKGISYEFKTEVGFVSDRVADHTKKHDVNFLVIDKSMRTGNREAFDDLMDHVGVPVVIVP